MNASRRDAFIHLDFISSAKLKLLYIALFNQANYTVLCTYLNPNNIFASVAKQSFQKYFCTTQSLNKLSSFTFSRKSTLLRAFW